MKFSISGLFGFGSNKPKYLKSSELKKGSVLVKPLNPDADDMAEAFGIKAGRSRELEKLAEEYYKEASKYSDAVARISEICLHPNELGFAVYVMARRKTELTPRKNPLPESIKPLQVIKLGENGKIHDALGITHERSHELVDLVSNGYRKGKDLITVMENVSVEAKHPNELFFMSYVIGDLHHQHQRVGSLFEMLRGGKPEE